MNLSEQMKTAVERAGGMHAVSTSIVGNAFVTYEETQDAYVLSIGGLDLKPERMSELLSLSEDQDMDAFANSLSEDLEGNFYSSVRTLTIPGSVWRSIMMQAVLERMMHGAGTPDDVVTESPINISDTGIGGAYL